MPDGETTVAGHRDTDDVDMKEDGPGSIDQAELDQMREEENKLRRELEFKLKSTTIQRRLPRPRALINTNIIRPVGDAQSELNEWQNAEEMIKKEMLLMLHMDAINEPLGKSSQPPTSHNTIDRYSAYLRESYSSAQHQQTFTLEELEQVQINKIDL
jgi:pre-mRNA-splicing factor CDC5/CEF1